MDVLSDILGAVKLRSSLYFWTELTAAWGVRVPRYRNVARFHLALRGSCWVRVEKNEPLRLEAGDLVVIPHGAEHTLADTPETPCVEVDRVVELAGYTGRGALVYGGEDAGTPTRLVCGHLELGDDVESPFLRQLPACLLLRSHGGGSGPLDELYRLIGREVRDDRPGSSAVLNRLSEVMFIQAVRVWAEENEHEQGLLGALADRHLGRSLAAIHGEPGRSWTLESLAREAGLSRTLFAERFRRAVGFPPMHYVTFWRMQQARGLLSSGNLSLDAVAGRVGYESTAAFCRVFKKWVGENPGTYRRSRREQGKRTARTSRT